MRSDGHQLGDEVGPKAVLTAVAPGRRPATGAIALPNWPVDTAVLNGVEPMPHLILLAKVLAQIAVAALPGGLLLIGLYHWHDRRRKRLLQQSPNQDNAS